MFEGLGHDAGVADGFHEVHVAVPSGDNMSVKMTGNSGTGASPEVHPDVDALGADRGADELFGPCDGVHEGCQLGVIQIAQLGDVAVGRDQKMAVGIGVTVEENRDRLGLGQDESGIEGSLIGGWLASEAEETLALLELGKT